MFRIHFDPRVGCFTIQVLALGCFWVSVKKLADSNDKTDRLLFSRFEDAVSHVKTIGLDKLYLDRSENKYHEVVHGRVSEVDRFYTGSGVHHG